MSIDTLCSYIMNTYNTAAAEVMNAQKIPGEYPPLSYLISIRDVLSAISNVAEICKVPNTYSNNADIPVEYYTNVESALQELQNKISYELDNNERIGKDERAVLTAKKALLFANEKLVNTFL